MCRETGSLEFPALEDGIIRLWDKRGHFKGTIVPDRDDGAWRRYDAENRWLGTLNGEEADDCLPALLQ